jgi:hypothetical protein
MQMSTLASGSSTGEFVRLLEYDYIERIQRQKKCLSMHLFRLLVLALSSAHSPGCSCSSVWVDATPERLWYQKNADATNALAPEMTPKRLWHQRNADTRKALTPERLWHQKGSGTRKVLTPENG